MPSLTATQDNKLKVKIEFEADTVDQLRDLFQQFFNKNNNFPQNDSYHAPERATIIVPPNHEVSMPSNNQEVVEPSNELVEGAAKVVVENTNQSLEEYALSNDNKLKLFLNYLSTNSRKFVDYLIQRDEPVLTNEICEFTGINGNAGIGGALRGVTAAAKKVGIKFPIYKVKGGNGNASYEFRWEI